MKDYQFYPTPEDLCAKMWGKFKSRDFVRVLEPSAGDGRLVEAVKGKKNVHGERICDNQWGVTVEVDGCEIDISKHPLLREKKINVVGTDFMEMTDGAIYSHIIMNPPFADGAEHLIHAWDILYEGEIVCLLNAETLKNPFSKKRDFLNRLIEKHGTVEFIQDAFLDAERKTAVEVALVYLAKKPNERHDFLDDIIDGLEEDRRHKDDEDIEHLQELAIPTNVIENAVRAFNVAWAASKEAIIVETRAGHYRRILGRSLQEMQSNKSNPVHNSSPKNIQRKFEEAYNDLKDRGWTYVLRGTEVDKMTSSQVQRELESRFEEVKKMNFTVSNIYGFLQGLAMNKGQIQVDMACEMFDSITRYHSENTVYYMGWKSNDHHRTAGMRIKTRRFVLPGFKTSSYQDRLGYYETKRLEDMDKVFAMLDGKEKAGFGIADVFETRLKELRNGERISSDYFDVRYYPGIGTIHFFARNEKLIDQLNVLVGRQRQWVPENATKSENTAFWKQYDGAEKFNKDIKLSRNEAWSLFGKSYYNEKEKERLDKMIAERLVNAMEKHGFQTDFYLEGGSQTENPATDANDANDDGCWGCDGEAGKLMQIAAEVFEIA